MRPTKSIEIFALPCVLNALGSGDDVTAVDLERETLTARHRVLAVPSHHHAAERISALKLGGAE